MSDNDAIGAWISSIFTVPKAGPEWDGWERDKSYCQPCLCKFLEEHVWRWFLQERINGVLVVLSFFIYFWEIVPLSLMGRDVQVAGRLLKTAGMVFFFLALILQGRLMQPTRRYGYNCKTMVHQRAHAEGKNVCCVYSTISCVECRASADNSFVSAFVCADQG